MKPVLFYLSLLSLCLTSMAQSPIGNIFPFDVREYTVLDTASYRIDYKTTCILDPKNGEKVTNDMYLLIGRKMSKFGHSSVLDDEKEIIEIHNRGVGCGIDARGLAGIEVYKYPSGTKPYSELTVRLFVYSAVNTFIYQDELHPQSWTLASEYKEILGYSCQKATTTFRGRSYTAWVATAIPISNGPWLLGGAPGLILEAYDTKGEYVFEATGISRPQKVLPIVKYKEEYKRTERRKVRELCKRMHPDLARTLKASFPRARFHGVSTFYYNPIELE